MSSPTTRTIFSGSVWGSNLGSKPYLSLMVAIYAVVVLGAFAFIDFDPHHDGLMVAHVVALREGLVMHGEIYGQYGPVTPWSQLPYLLLPVSEGVALKIWNVAHIAATAALVADFWRVLPKAMNLRPWMAFVAAIAWVSTSDILLISNMLPWSSVHAAFLGTAGLYLLLAASRFLEIGRTRASNILVFTAGFLIGIIPFSRINVGLAIWFAVLVFMAVSFWMFRKRFIPPVLPLLMGFLTSIFIIFTMLLVTQSLSSYVQQSVLGPLEWSAGASGEEGWNTIPMLAYTGLRVLPAMMFLALSVFTWFMLARNKNRLPRLGRYLLALLGFALFSLASIEIAEAREKLVAFVATPSVQNAYDFALRVFATGDHLYLYLAIILAVVSWTAAMFVLVFDGKANKSNDNASIHALGLMGLVTGAMLVQLYPTWDLRHVWWGSPLVHLVLFMSIRLIFKKTLAPLVVTMAFAFAVSLSFLLSGVLQLQLPRTPAPQGTIAEGIALRPEQQEYFEGAAQLARMIPTDAKVAFVVRDGALPVVFGDYMATDKNFVWWADYGRDVSTYISGSDFVWADAGSISILGYEDFEDFAGELGVSLVDCAGSSCLFEIDFSPPSG